MDASLNEVVENPNIENTPVLQNTKVLDIPMEKLLRY